MVYNQENLIANAIGKNPSNQCAGPASLPTRVWALAGGRKNNANSMAPNNATASDNTAGSNQKNNRKYEVPKEAEAPTQISLDKSKIENR